MCLVPFLLRKRGINERKERNRKKGTEKKGTEKKETEKERKNDIKIYYILTSYEK